MATHVKLVGALDAERYLLPGVGELPDFMVPVRAFRVEDIINKTLIAFEIHEGKLCCTGQDGTLALTPPVAGVLGREGKPRRFGSLSAVAREDGAVHVVFGHTPLKEEWEDVPCADVRGISTPPTPPVTD